MGLPWWLSGKESACSAGDVGSVPGSGRSSGGWQPTPVLYSPWGCRVGHDWAHMHTPFVDRV